MIRLLKKKMTLNTLEETTQKCAILFIPRLRRPPNEIALLIAGSGLSRRCRCRHHHHVNVELRWLRQRLWLYLSARTLPWSTQTQLKPKACFQSTQEKCKASVIKSGAKHESFHFVQFIALKSFLCAEK